MSETIKTISITNTKENVLYFLNNPNSKQATGSRIGDLEKKVEDFICTKYVPRTWKEVQDIVRSGEAQKILQIGEQFVVNKTKEDGTIEKLVFDIIGFDHDIPTDTNYKHSMTLQLHECYEEMAFDGKEATWYVDPETYPEGLPPNTYQFTFSNKKFIFTTTKTVPPKGQLMFDFNVRAGGKITIYENPITTEEFEVCAVTYGEADNILPTISNTPESNMVNTTLNARFGSNTWSTSATRQWLNSSEKEWYHPLNNFDRTCISDDGVNTTDFSGFLYGIEPEFLEVLGEVNKTTTVWRTVSATPVNSTEKIFLLSVPEIFGTPYNDTYTDGTVYEYYDAKHSSRPEPSNSSVLQRVKVNKKGETCNYWLRTAMPTIAYRTYTVTQEGALTYLKTITKTFGVAPACVIV